MTIAEESSFWLRGQQPLQQPTAVRQAGPNLVDELLPIGRGFNTEAPKYTSGHDRGYVIDDPEDLAAARHAVADTYLFKNYVTPGQIDDDGYICAEIDPHVDDSVYFGFGRDGALAATARLIYKPNLEDFPAIREFDIDVKKLQALNLDPAKFAEISALAKIKGVGSSKDILHVYARMMRHSLEGGQNYWLMSADSNLVGRLHQLFGAESFTELGPEREYMGSKTVPMAMDIHSSLKLYNKLFMPSYIKRIFTENLRGMDASQLGLKEQKILKRHGVIDEVTGSEGKSLLTPERVGIAGLVAYSLARAIPVGTLDDYGVNPYIFLGIDIATIPPYVMGTSKMIRSKNAKSSIVGGVVAGAAFAAPYMYLGAEGQEMPPLPAAVVTAYMGVAGVLAYRRTKGQAKAARETQTEST